MECVIVEGLSMIFKGAGQSFFGQPPNPPNGGLKTTAILKVPQMGDLGG
jgi:hypothetical protein